MPYRPHERPWCTPSALRTGARPSTTSSAPRDDRSTPGCATTRRPAGWTVTSGRSRQRPAARSSADRTVSRRLHPRPATIRRDLAGSSRRPAQGRIRVETPWRATRISTGKPLAKRRTDRHAFDGFKAEADAAPGGGHSEIEFIVDPPVEEGDAGERRLTTVMRGLTRLGGQMERASITTDAKPVDAEEGRAPTPETQVRFFRQYTATGRLVDDDYAIVPRGVCGLLRRSRAGSNSVRSRGWVTRLRPRPGDVRDVGDVSNVGDMGDMGELAHMIDAIDYGDGGAHADARAFELPPAMARGAATLRSRAAQVEGTPALPNPSEDLKGLIGVIASYLVQGAASVTHRLPQAARQSLAGPHRFREALPAASANEQSLLRTDTQLWIDLVIEASSRETQRFSEVASTRIRMSSKPAPREQARRI